MSRALDLDNAVLWVPWAWVILEATAAVMVLALGWLAWRQPR
jgi:hypothetical protein